MISLTGSRFFNMNQYGLMVLCSLLAGCVSLADVRVKNTCVMDEKLCAAMDAGSRLCAVKQDEGLIEWRLIQPEKTEEVLGVTGGMAETLAEFQIDPGQNYIALVTAEEGHPMLTVYDLRVWIQQRLRPVALFYLNPYPGYIGLKGWGDEAVNVHNSKWLHFESDGPVLATDIAEEHSLAEILQYRVSLPDGRVEIIK